MTGPTTQVNIPEQYKQTVNKLYTSYKMVCTENEQLKAENAELSAKCEKLAAMLEYYKQKDADYEHLSKTFAALVSIKPDMDTVIAPITASVVGTDVPKQESKNAATFK